MKGCVHTSPANQRSSCCGRVQLDAVLGQASAVSGNLGDQRRLFEGTGNKLMTLTAKFPLVNNVLNSIRRKKSKVCHSMGSPSWHTRKGLPVGLTACLSTRNILESAAGVCLQNGNSAVLACCYCIYHRILACTCLVAVPHQPWHLMRPCHCLCMLSICNSMMLSSCDSSSTQCWYSGSCRTPLFSHRSSPSAHYSCWYTGGTSEVRAAGCLYGQSNLQHGLYDRV